MSSYEELFIHKDRKGRITLKPIELIKNELSIINNFCDAFVSKDKLALLIDSHLPEFDLQNHFENEVDPFLWGDPNKTNDKIVYFCDSKKISDRDIYNPKMRKYLQDSICNICMFHGDANRLLVVCVNKSMAEEVKKLRKQKLIPDVKITWYRSTETKGVRAEGNVQIMIGGPYIPLASYHHKVAREANADKAEAWNKAFRKSNMDTEFVNASTRVKDPEGVYESYIYCLGITLGEVSSFLDLQGELYNLGSVKRPHVISYVKTGIGAEMWIEMTRFYMRRGEICDVEKHLPYILELQRVYVKDRDRVGIHRIFREKTKEAVEAICKNVEFLMSIDVYIESKGRGHVLVLNDKNPY